MRTPLSLKILVCVGMDLKDPQEAVPELPLRSFLVRVISWTAFFSALKAIHEITFINTSEIPIGYFRFFWQSR